MNTNPSALVVTSNVPASVTTNDIRGIKAPIEIPSGWAWLGWTLAIAALVALGWHAWRRWRKKPVTLAPEIIVPPHERAREKLRQALGLISEPRPFCTLVSDTIRVYLEECFNLHAPDRTTEEFLEELRFSALLTNDQKLTLGEFLTRCDLVKFARYEPWEAELRDLYEVANRLIDETRPVPAVADIGQRGAGQPSDSGGASKPGAM